ncbi:MAG: YkgJ family cysteine cluster protein [candidate division Zixibacteria bacterium]|nr:YkgJ family cysteine cluster protein [candidate division Zixibacteria bacterium]
MRELQQLKEEILKEYPRMNEDDEFTFACHPGVPCFNKCCADINIFLTPYDVIRLKNRLGITSAEFLSKYTISPFDKNLPYPVILLKMQDNEKKSCHFVGDKGCGVYEDRPWACRMYPLGMASPAEGNPHVTEEFFFLLQEPMCKGFNEDRKLKVSDWLTDQGIHDYNEIGELFKDITLHKFFTDGHKLTPDKIEMFFTVCYNTDSFRSFVFKSSFTKKFVVADDVLEKIKTDDVELLKFGYQWLRFACFAEDTMVIREEVAEDKKKELKMRQKLPKDE